MCRIYTLVSFFAFAILVHVNVYANISVMTPGRVKKLYKNVQQFEDEIADEEENTDDIWAFNTILVCMALMPTPLTDISRVRNMYAWRVVKCEWHIHQHKNMRMSPKIAWTRALHTSAEVELVPNTFVCSFANFIQFKQTKYIIIWLRWYFLAAKKTNHNGHWV